MLTPKVHILQNGILAGYRVVEIDFTRGVMIRRIKAGELLEQIQAVGEAKYLYLKLSHGNLQDKALPKLTDKLAALNMQIYASIASNTVEGLAAIIHALSGVELNFTNIKSQEIERICLLAATRELQLNLSWEQTPELDSFLPLFAQLRLANINLYLPDLDNVGKLPDNVRAYIKQL